MEGKDVLAELKGVLQKCFWSAKTCFCDFPLLVGDVIIPDFNSLLYIRSFLPLTFSSAQLNYKYENRNCKPSSPLRLCTQVAF
jgi:hypothetical protein